MRLDQLETLIVTHPAYATSGYYIFMRALWPEDYYGRLSACAFCMEGVHQ